MRRVIAAFLLLISLFTRFLGVGAGTRETNRTPEERAAEIAASMTLDEKLWQLFIVEPEALTGEPVTTGGEALAAALSETPVAGIALFGGNLVSPEQTRALTRSAKDAAKYGLFVAVDEEGGPVARLMNAFGDYSLGPMYDYRNLGEDTARENAETIGQVLLSYGFNLDFAPVADVWTNPENRVIGARAYSDDPQEAAKLTAAAVRGFHDAGAVCTLKHFPGHGDTVADSHTGQARVELSREEIERTQLPPFQAGIDAGADLVMVGHLTVPALDDGIATLSYDIVTNLLREELGFDGVVITDALNMSAASGLCSPGELAVRAVKAGVDILLMPTDLQTSVDALRSAVETGEIGRERIDESVTRILAVKVRYGIVS